VQSLHQFSQSHHFHLNPCHFKKFIMLKTRILTRFGAMANSRLALNLGDHQRSYCSSESCTEVADKTKEINLYNSMRETRSSISFGITPLNLFPINFLFSQVYNNNKNKGYSFVSFLNVQSSEGITPAIVMSARCLEF
jgi:hypothetical protein